MERSDRGGNEHPAELNLSKTNGSEIFSGTISSSNVREQIPSAICSGGCETYENDRGSSFLSAEMRKTSENVRKI